jgi:hypothetical protein
MVMAGALIHLQTDQTLIIMAGGGMGIKHFSLET